ncbi:cupin domain-containing protein [Pseudomonas granadensis]|uniref:cupin domain-containing protein n=1 Tax=Pseudomonas granadensis TaxID=1421430 RepID=UPI00300EADCA
MKALPLPLLAAALAFSLSTAALAHDPSEKVTVLQEQLLKNAPGKKAMMIEVDYQPGQSSIAHKHDGTAMAYVLEGEVISQVKGEQPITYKKGQFWYEPAGSEHLVSKNASQSKPARLLVFMVLAPDEPVLIPLKD